jgi:hypothetical protein
MGSSADSIFGAVRGISFFGGFAAATGLAAGAAFFSLVIIFSL